MVNRRKLAIRALRMALATRQDHRVRPSSPINVYDLAAEVGVEVLFQELRGVEGLYLSKPRPMILVAAQRPLGRQAYTCAHELGHHFMGHTMSADDGADIGAGSSAAQVGEEFLVESFAGFLLMPPRVVRQAFELRDADPASCSPSVFYTVAHALGVGYMTLVHHAFWALGLIDSARFRALSKTTPKRIKTLMLGRPFSGDVVVVDQHWPELPVDIRVGDLLLTGEARIDSGSAVSVDAGPDDSVVFRGRAPGEAKVDTYGRARLVRVSRRDYVGRATNRFLEDPDYE